MNNNGSKLTREDLYTLDIVEGQYGWVAGASSKLCPNRHSHGKMLSHPLGALGCSTCKAFEIASTVDPVSDSDPLAARVHDTATRVLAL